MRAGLLSALLREPALLFYRGSMKRRDFLLNSVALTATLGLPIHRALADTGNPSMKFIFVFVKADGTPLECSQMGLMCLAFDEPGLNGSASAIYSSFIMTIVPV